MARFSLKNNISDRILGRGLLTLATLKSITRKSVRASNSGDEALAASAMSLFEEHIKNEYLDTSAPQGPLGFEEPVVVKYHYDGLSDEGYVLHIVVPDIGDKEVELVPEIDRGDLPKVKLPSQSTRLLDSPTYDFTDFAAESLGHIVIFGCGR